ncbi:hypothetical protein Avbf_05133 [Armadillidium vulgare]|nr:hypothetical protein Avbf_05133 [Armadillidium vulgare]
MTSIACSTAFDKLSTLLSYKSTHCDIYMCGEKSENQSSLFCPNNKSCQNFQKKFTECICKGVPDIRNSVSIRSGFSNTSKTSFVTITIDSYENYQENLWTLLKKNQDNIYIEFILKFEGLNTIHKYEISSRVSQAINFFLIRKGYRLVRSSGKNYKIKQYLTNENLE